MSWGKPRWANGSHVHDFLAALDREFRRIEARAALQSLLALAKGIGQLFVLEGD